MSSLGLKIKVPRDSIIKLNEWQNKRVVVKFMGGREIEGVMLSWDKTMNMVLNGCLEVLEVHDKEVFPRELGLVIVKGTQVHSISLKDGYEIIDNPYLVEPLEGIKPK